MSYVLFALAALALLMILALILWGLRRFGVDFASSFVSDGAAKIIVSVIMAVFVLGIGGEITKIWLQNYHNKHWATCTVTKTTETSGKKRVYTSDCGLLQVRDTNWQLNRHSGDTFGKIPNTGKVRLQIVGTRWSFQSWIPTILDAKPVDKG